MHRNRGFKMVLIGIKKMRSQLINLVNLKQLIIKEKNVESKKDKFYILHTKFINLVRNLKSPRKTKYQKMVVFIKYTP